MTNETMIEAETRTRYRVTAPCVSARAPGSVMADRGAWTIRTLYRDDLLPEGAHPDDVARLLRKGMVEPIEVRA